MRGSSGCVRLRSPTDQEPLCAISAAISASTFRIAVSRSSTSNSEPQEIGPFDWQLTAEGFVRALTTLRTSSPYIREAAFAQTCARYCTFDTHGSCWSVMAFHLKDADRDDLVRVGVRTGELVALHVRPHTGAFFPHLTTVAPTWTPLSCEHVGSSEAAWAHVRWPANATAAPEVLQQSTLGFNVTGGPATLSTADGRAAWSCDEAFLRGVHEAFVTIATWVPPEP